MNDLTESTAILVTAYKPNYGASTSLVDTPTKTVTYCVHGKPAKNCCDDVENGLEIKMIEKHCHRPRTEGVDKKARKKLIIASILCIIFMFVEIVGGVLSNSLAIATDAAHLLADLASFMISLFAIWIAARPSTKRLSFGWYRAEVIGALVSVLMIWLVTAILFYMAVLRIINPDFTLDARIMLISSVIGLVVNIIMGATLHQHSGHSGHSHGEKTSVSSSLEESGGSEQNMNVRAAFIHVISDFIQSLGVFIGALVIYFKPEWNIIDPIITFLFSVLVLATTIAIMKDALLVLMEGTPKYLDYTEVMQIFLQIEGVVRVHNLRIWALSINKIALSAHLAVAPNTNAEQVLKTATQQVHTKYNFFETTLQIEEFQADMEDCHQCSNPNI